MKILEKTRLKWTKEIVANPCLSNGKLHESWGTAVVGLDNIACTLYDYLLLLAKLLANVKFISSQFSVTKFE